MLAWALAKVHGRTKASKGGKHRNRHGFKPGARSLDVDALLLELATEATSRLPDNLSPQSVSNIAWALATLDLLNSALPAQHAELAPARGFIYAAASAATRNLNEYTPQAIANLLWAIVRVEPIRANFGTTLPTELASFASTCAQETMMRMLEFSWRDLAGVCVAFAYCQLRTSHTLNFMTLLAGHLPSRCHEMAPQAMFNIAQSFTRMGMATSTIQPVVDAIAFTIRQRGLRLNDVDLRQWREVCDQCRPCH